jgi:monothiol glutaredoxin
MGISPDFKKRIDDLVGKNKVVLFMKGSRRFPQCGFSAGVVQILDQLVPTYETVNILQDQEARDGMKDYSEWPTFPQLYVDGKFVGGADIVREMFGAGELQAMLGAEVRPLPPVKTPSITISPSAAKAFKDAGADPGDVLRLELGPDFRPDLFFGPKQDGDLVAESEGLALHMDRGTASRADGLSIDYVTGPQGAGFKIDNPNEPPRVKQIGPEELKALMDAGKVHVFDVRTAGEREIAVIKGAVWLEGDGIKQLEALPKDAPIAFHCHRGMRSQQAAEQLLARGWTNLMNLRGGIQAWSTAVDPSVPKY